MSQKTNSLKNNLKKSFKVSNKNLPVGKISKIATLAMNLQFRQRRRDFGASINHKTVYFFFAPIKTQSSDF